MAYKQKNFKGKYGLFLQHYIIKKRYNISYNSQLKKYDLPSVLNLLNFKNVSVKSTQSNTIYCSDVFNFLKSNNLELLVISYRGLLNNIQVNAYYLFEDLNTFFLHLNSIFDPLELLKLNAFLKSLVYPYTKAQRSFCRK